MQAFGNNLDSFNLQDSTSQGPSSPYMPVAGRADRLAANIPGASQSNWGNNGDHMGTGMGGSNH